MVVVSFKGVWRKYFDTGVALRWVKAEMSQSWGRGYFGGRLRRGIRTGRNRRRRRMVLFVCGRRRGRKVVVDVVLLGARDTFGRGVEMQKPP